MIINNLAYKYITSQRALKQHKWKHGLFGDNGTVSHVALLTASVINQHSDRKVFDIMGESQWVLCIYIYLLALGDPCMQSIYCRISKAFVSRHGGFFFKFQSGEQSDCLLSASLKLCCSSKDENDSERADQFLPYYSGWSDLG